MKSRIFGVWLFIFLCWATYRIFFQFNELTDELIFKPLIFILPVFLIVRFYEKNSLTSLGLWMSAKDLFLDMYIGVTAGIIFAFEGLYANYLKYGEFTFHPILAVQFSGGVFAFLLSNLGTSFSEEILGRGYLYRRLYQHSGSQFASALLSSLLFLLLHFPILFSRLDLTGPSLILYPISILLLSMTNCYLFTIRGNLALPIMIHLFWNMTVALYL